jgi:predicted nucleic acid-binding protein
MKSVFADTSFYLAVVNPKDALHARAMKVSSKFRGRVVTTHYVLMELGNALSRAEHRAGFVALVRQLRGDPDTIIVPASDDLFNQGLDLFAHRIDKDWSLTDCISFEVMNQRRIAEALTEDHHFTQAGFRALLR